MYHKWFSCISQNFSIHLHSGNINLCSLPANTKPPCDSWSSQTSLCPARSGRPSTGLLPWMSAGMQFHAPPSPALRASLLVSLSVCLSTQLPNDAIKIGKEAVKIDKDLKQQNIIVLDGKSKGYNKDSFKKTIFLKYVVLVKLLHTVHIGQITVYTCTKHLSISGKHINAEFNVLSYFQAWVLKESPKGVNEK